MSLLCEGGITKTGGIIEPCATNDIDENYTPVIPGKSSRFCYMGGSDAAPAARPTRPRVRPGARSGAVSEQGPEKDTHRPAVTVLSGGVGGARFLQGLLRLLDRSAQQAPGAPSASVTVVANTADDIWVHGLKVCPDLDTVMYTL